MIASCARTTIVSAPLPFRQKLWLLPVDELLQLYTSFVCCCDVELYRQPFSVPPRTMVTPTLYALRLGRDAPHVTFVNHQRRTVPEQRTNRRLLRCNSPCRSMSSVIKSSSTLTRLYL